MRRYWVETNSLQGDLVHFQGDVFHHIFGVCRQELGSHFEILIGDQVARLVEVTEVRKKEAWARIQETRPIPDLPRPLIHLVLSIPRFPVMEAILEKAVELGVAAIIPVFSDLSFIHKMDSLPNSKWERWQKIIVSATQQSGRGQLMQLMPPQNLTSVQESLNRTKGQVGLFAYEGPGQLTLRQALHPLRTDTSENPQEIWVFVGSEGGYSEQEVQSFQRLGLVPITLGDQVLRVETACIALLAVLKYELVKTTNRP